MKIKELRYVPHPVAYKLLAESLSKRPSQEERSIGATVVSSTLEYLRMFSKCVASQAEKAVEELKALGLSEFAAVMLVNILPTTIYEVKAILGAARTGLTLTEEELHKILEILENVCTERLSPQSG